MLRAASLALCGLVLASCAGSDLTGGEDARKGGTITVALERPPDSLDPALASRPESRRLVWLAYTPLLTLRRAEGRDGTDVVPGLARAMPQVSDGGRAWRLELRPGLRYSDGTPVRARDVPASLRRVRASGSPGARLLDGVRSVRADDRRRSVTFRLRAPDAAFAYVLASTYAAPVPAGTPPPRRGRRPPPGVGPYRLGPVRPGGRVELVRRRRFRLPGVPGGNVDRISVHVERSARRRARAALEGRLDLTGGALPAALLPEVRSKYADRYDEQAGTATTFFALDSTRPPFDEFRVRAAANHAVDSEAFGRLLDGRLEPGCTLLPPSVAGHREPDPCPWGDPAEPADLRQAAELVREAGARGRQVAVSSGPARSDRAVARSFARLLRKLGLRARAAAPGERGQARLVRLRPALPSAERYLRPLGRLDPSLARSIARVPSTQDPDRAADAWGAVDAELVERARVVPLGYDEQATLMSPRMDAESCPVSHPLYAVDLSSVCLK